ncbi:MAG: class I SAM-dependent methyltransferase, partial [Thermoplasmata archaeon]|nr:class I SAM-dependent methyltransferase [Thermoplasmata archaeon]
LLRQASLDRVSKITGSGPAELKSFRHDLFTSDVPELLLQRGVSLPFTRELPQGALLYLIVRALRPQRVVETGVGPGYSTAWLLAGLEANREGELISLGPGPTQGRANGVHDATVGQFVAPSLRSRWTLALGNTEENLTRILSQNAGRVDLFLYDNGPEVNRARFELREAWTALSPSGILLAHHIDATPAWGEFCRLQGLSLQVLDAGPPPMGGLEMRPGRLG